MIQLRRFNARGFTLIEMLVYLAIFMTVAAASVTLMISLSSLIDQYRLETKLYRTATGAMEQVLLAVRQADQVDLTGTELASSTIGKLRVSNAATTTDFVLTDDTIELSRNGTLEGPLTASGVTVDGFTVYRYSTSRGELVRVRIDLTGTTDGISRSLSVQGGAVIRGAL